MQVFLQCRQIQRDRAAATACLYHSHTQAPAPALERATFTNTRCGTGGQTADWQPGRWQGRADSHERAGGQARRQAAPPHLANRVASIRQHLQAGAPQAEHVVGWAVSHLASRSWVNRSSIQRWVDPGPCLARLLQSFLALPRCTVLRRRGVPQQQGTPLRQARRGGDAGADAASAAAAARSPAAAPALVDAPQPWQLRPRQPGKRGSARCLTLVHALSVCRLRRHSQSHVCGTNQIGPAPC